LAAAPHNRKNDTQTNSKHTSRFTKKHPFQYKLHMQYTIRGVFLSRTGLFLTGQAGSAVCQSQGFGHFVQIAVQAIAGIIFAYIFSIIKINGSPIEVFKWSWDILGISLIIIVALVSNVLCWFLRTYAMNFVNPTAVSVIMPFSAVVTGIVSVIFGMDTLSLEFIFGGIISLGAVILSSIADIKYEHKDNKSN
jgi:drug/metabolite transporter (DMT)-like permease